MNLQKDFVTIDGHNGPFNVSTTVRLCADDDPGENWPAFVRAIRIKENAGKRHMTRVAASIKALTTSLFEDAEAYGEMPREMREGFAFLMEAEANGCGGPMGFKGGATARSEWARDLGKGRANASDGDAWNAAFRAAAIWLRAATDEGTFFPEPWFAAMWAAQNTDPELCLFSECLRRAAATHEPHAAHNWMFVARYIACQADDAFIKKCEAWIESPGKRVDQWDRPLDPPVATDDPILALARMWDISSESDELGDWVEAPEAQVASSSIDVVRRSPPAEEDARW